MGVRPDAPTIETIVPLTFDEIIKFRISLESGKNGVSASVGARGPERNAPEASVGFPLIPEDKSLFPPEEAGGIFSAPSTKKSAPYGSKRAGLAPGPWKHWVLRTLSFSKNE
jgi:hypothetical protein